MLIFCESGEVYSDKKKIGDVSRLESGHYYFFPENSRGGCYPDWLLLEVGEYMKELNDAFDIELNAAMK